MSEPFRLWRACTPLLISVPHAGTRLPHGLAERFTSEGRALPDTDWFIDQLWEGAIELGAGFLVARFSRYAVDLNRPPDDAPLYGGSGSGLVPLETFSGAAIYRPGKKPGSRELRARRVRYWRPYHAALAAELKRIQQAHGYALLLDAHSIRSRVPRLFDGHLPDLSLGSFDGASAAPGLIRSAREALRGWAGCSCVLDGRFKGGYITRHYGRPERGVHALQLEMSQRVYMQEKPPAILPRRMSRAQALARTFAQALLDWNPAHE